MPKAEPHFDCAALVAAVHDQDIGIRISTNNPEGFKRTLYAHMRKHPQMKVHIYKDPKAPNALMLLKQESSTFTEEAAHG